MIGPRPKTVAEISAGIHRKILEATEEGFKAGLRISQPEALKEIERLREEIKSAREKAEADLTVLYGTLLNQVGVAAGVPNIGFKAPEAIAAMTVERIRELGAEVEAVRRERVAAASAGKASEHRVIPSGYNDGHGPDPESDLCPHGFDPSGEPLCPDCAPKPPPITHCFIRKCEAKPDPISGSCPTHATMERCSRCDGTGTIKTSSLEGLVQSSSPCPSCKGAGAIEGLPF